LVIENTTASIDPFGNVIIDADGADEEVTA
jgi:hypothetical protein